MDEKIKVELLEKFKDLSLIDLWDLSQNKDNPQTIKLIKSFISENYEPNPQLELEKSIKEINSMNWPESKKIRLMNVKIFIRDLKEKLDSEHINGFVAVETILLESIKRNKVLLG